MTQFNTSTVTVTSRAAQVGIVCAAALAFAALLLSLHATTNPERQQTDLAGARLFDGRDPLAGRMAGHNNDLPALATRCANCHRDRTGIRSQPGFQVLAPRLNRQSLTRRHSRTGGPTYQYNTTTFCDLLRTGIDGSGIMIDTTMPRYTVTDTQCQALWQSIVADTNDGSTR